MPGLQDWVNRWVRVNKNHVRFPDDEELQNQRHVQIRHVSSHSSSKARQPLPASVRKELGIVDQESYDTSLTATSRLTRDTATTSHQSKYRSSKHSSGRHAETSSEHYVAHRKTPSSRLRQKQPRDVSALPLPNAMSTMVSSSEASGGHLTSQKKSNPPQRLNSGGYEGAQQSARATERRRIGRRRTGRTRLHRSNSQSDMLKEQAFGDARRSNDIEFLVEIEQQQQHQINRYQEEKGQPQLEFPPKSNMDISPSYYDGTPPQSLHHLEDESTSSTKQFDPRLQRRPDGTSIHGESFFTPPSMINDPATNPNLLNMHPSRRHSDTHGRGRHLPTNSEMRQHQHDHQNYKLKSSVEIPPNAEPPASTQPIMEKIEINAKRYNAQQQQQESQSSPHHHLHPPPETSALPSRTVVGSHCEPCEMMERKMNLMQGDVEYLRSIALSNERRESQHSYNNITYGHDNETSSINSASSILKKQQKHQLENSGELSRMLEAVTLRHKKQIEQMTKERARWQLDMQLKIGKFALMCKELNEESAVRKETIVVLQTELAAAKTERNALASEIDTFKMKLKNSSANENEIEELRKTISKQDQEMMDRSDIAIKKRDIIIEELAKRLDYTVRTLEMEREQHRQRRQIIFPTTRPGDQIEPAGPSMPMKLLTEELSQTKEDAQESKASLEEFKASAAMREQFLLSKCDTMSKQLRAMERRLIAAGSSPTSL